MLELALIKAAWMAAKEWQLSWKSPAAGDHASKNISFSQRIGNEIKIKNDKVIVAKLWAWSTIKALAIPHLTAPTKDYILARQLWSYRRQESSKIDRSQSPITSVRVISFAKYYSKDPCLQIFPCIISISNKRRNDSRLAGQTPKSEDFNYMDAQYPWHRKRDYMHKKI